MRRLCAPRRARALQDLLAPLITPFLAPHITQSTDARSTAPAVSRVSGPGATRVRDAQKQIRFYARIARPIKTRRKIGDAVIALLAPAVMLGALSGCGTIESVYNNSLGSSGAAPGASRPVSAAAPAPLNTAPRIRVHRVAPGDTLYSLARRYGVGLAQLKAMNGIGPGAQISVGQELRVPEAEAAPPALAAAPAQNHLLTQERAQAAASALAPQRLVRPVPGEILRGWGEGVGRRKNAGVDLAAAPGDQVRAAAAGKVAFVSDQTSPVGAVVLMQHPGGMTTIYGRLQEITVRPGQHLRAGEPFARIAPRLGDRAALHFEIRYGSEPVNPTPFL